MSNLRKTFLVEAGDHRFRVDLRRTSKGFRVERVLHHEGSASPQGNPGQAGFDAFYAFGGRAPLDTGWVAPLLKRGPRPASDIAVLTDRTTAVVTEIPGDGGGAELEAQTISGLSSSEAVTATTRLPAEAGLFRCWTVQAAMRDVAALRTAVAGAKRGRLVSVGHPGGVRLDATAPQLESWSEFSLYHAGGGERIDLRGWNGPDALAEALEDPEVASTCTAADGGACVLLAVRGEAIGSIESELLFDFREKPVIEAWSAALARSCDPLTGRVLGMPLISVPKPPPSSASLVASAIGMSVVALLLMGGHYWVTERSQQRLQTELVELKEPVERLASQRQRITQLTGELKQLVEEEQKSASVANVDVFAHRKRIGALLDGIAEGAEIEKAVVLEMKPDGLETVIAGVATTFNAPQDLAGRIDRALADHGWRASLVRRTAKLLRADGGPWTYEIRLSPGRPIPLDQPAQKGLFGLDLEISGGSLAEVDSSIKPVPPAGLQR